MMLLKVLPSLPHQIWKRTVATGLEKVSFHSNPKEGQCQRRFKRPYNCAHFRCQQGYAQNPSSQASAIHEPRTYITNWVQKRQRKQRSVCTLKLLYFHILSCSAGIPSPPLALFLVMVSKAHLTSHSKMFYYR